MQIKFGSWCIFALATMTCAQVSADSPISIRILTYNIHHAEGTDRRLDLDRIADVIREAKPDVVALQEIDQKVERSNHVDQPAELASRLGMHSYFGGNLKYQGGDYGNLLLSRWPIRSAMNHPCPRFDDGEPRGIIEAIIELPNGSNLRIFATHFDHRSNERERIASAELVNQLLDRNPEQTKPDRIRLDIFTGDLNAIPDSQTLTTLSSHWNTKVVRLPTVPSSKPSRQIDYVLASRRSSVETVSTEVINEPIASDHRPVLVVMRLGNEKPISEANEKPVSKVLFGSCIQQDRPIPIFQTMTKEEPELAIFLGDNIYADTSDIQVMRAKYSQLAKNELFQTFRRACRCLATWDDHDFGLNDSGSSYAMRDDAQKAFLDFWDEPSDSIRRHRSGVYESHSFGPIGKNLQIILLDTRYFRSDLKKGEKRIGGEYVPDDDPSKTMLGDAQWKWLEGELQKPAKFRIIATSIQCLASDAGQETWSNFPREQTRLFQLIKKTHATGVVFISGDRHWAELSSVHSNVPYPLYEMTSSSFNQIHPRGSPTDNQHRHDPRTYHRENYGVIQIDWNQLDPILELQVRDIEGNIQIDRRIQLSELQF